MRRFGIIFSLFVPFFLSVPATGSSNFFGLIPVTGKLLTYIIGLQVLNCSFCLCNIGLRLGYTLAWPGGSGGDYTRLFLLI